MEILLNTDNHIAGTEALERVVEAKAKNALHRFITQLTRLEVHLSDQSGDKHGGNDKRCMIEARIAGRQPIAVHHDAPDVDLAIDGALERLGHLLTTTLEKARR